MRQSQAKHRPAPLRHIAAETRFPSSFLIILFACEKEPDQPTIVSSRCQLMSEKHTPKQRLVASNAAGSVTTSFGSEYDVRERDPQAHTRPDSGKLLRDARGVRPWQIRGPGIEPRAFQ